MGTFFDDRVEFAAEQLYTVRRRGNGEAAKKALEEAAAEGNADAYYFLARIYSGQYYVNPYLFQFETNDAFAHECIDKSIEMGSDIAMIASFRHGGYSPRCGSYVHAYYESIREPWEKIKAKANAGSLICKYVVANAIYYMDHLLFEDRKYEQGYPDRLTDGLYALKLYQELMEQGMFGINNYILTLQNGEFGIPKDLQKVKELNAVRYKMIEFCYIPVKGDEYGIEDATLALKSYEEQLAMGNHFAYGKLGRVYLVGGRGVSKNYDLAAQYLIESRKYMDETADLMGTCFLKGYGVAVDYEKARKEFEIIPHTRFSRLGLGEMYAYGYGVEANPDLALRLVSGYENDPRAAKIIHDIKK